MPAGTSLTTNNVIPVLPADVICVWHDSTSREGELTGALREIREAGLGGPKPFLVRVTRSRLIQIPLHEALHPLQSHAARDPEVQGEVRFRVYLALAGTYHLIAADSSSVAALLPSRR